MILRFGKNYKRHTKQKQFYLINLIKLKKHTLNILINFIKNYKYCTLLFIFIIILNFINLSTNAATLIGYNEKQVWSYLKNVPRKNITNKCKSSLDRVN